MRPFEIIAAVLLAVLQCGAFLIYGPRLIAKLAQKLEDIINSVEDLPHDNG